MILFSPLCYCRAEIFSFPVVFDKYSLCFYHRIPENHLGGTCLETLSLNKNAIRTAMRIACDAHRNQLDKSGLPYILHPLHVAVTMDTEEEICTALLHDVLEDSAFTVSDLRQAGVSEPVLEALQLLTRDRQTPYLSYIAAIRENALARRVKIADLLHNSDLSRLETVTPRDLRRHRKYAIALAVLAEDPAAGDYRRKRIPLGADWNLRIDYLPGRSIEEWFLEGPGKTLPFHPKELMSKDGLSLPEMLAEHLAQGGEASLLSMITE